MSGDAIREAAEHYYHAACLFEDEDLDPSDHAEVVRRAFTSSDCDDFAAALSAVTGWPAVRMSWDVRDEPCHHALVRAPDGRLLDVCGWTDEKALARRYKARGATFAEAAPFISGIGHDVWDGVDDTLRMIVGVIREMPVAPYRDPWFRELSSRPVEGVDVPLPDLPAP